MRYGSFGYYQLDACPRCGFAYGTNMQDIEDKNPLDVWKAILKADGQFLKDAGLPISINGMYEWVMSFTSPPDDRETVFKYNKAHLDRYKKSKLYKERIRKSKEIVVFT